MSTTQNLHRSQQLLLLSILLEKSTPRISFLNALRLIKFLSSLLTFDQMKGLGSAGTASHRPLYQSGVVQNHSFLGFGVHF